MISLGSIAGADGGWFDVACDGDEEGMGGEEEDEGCIGTDG